MVDKLVNGVLSSSRVQVEHALSGVKRCRIVKESFRLHGTRSKPKNSSLEEAVASEGDDSQTLSTPLELSDQVMEIACALHNLRRDCRQNLPQLTFKLPSLVLRC